MASAVKGAMCLAKRLGNYRRMESLCQLMAELALPIHAEPTAAGSAYLLYLTGCECYHAIVIARILSRIYTNDLPVPF